MDDAVVVDFGSDTFKAGWSNSFPSLEEPRAVGLRLHLVSPRAITPHAGLKAHQYHRSDQLQSMNSRAVHPSPAQQPYTAMQSSIKAISGTGKAWKNCSTTWSPGRCGEPMAGHHSFKKLSSRDFALTDMQALLQLGWDYEAPARMLVTEALFASKVGAPIQHPAFLISRWSSLWHVPAHTHTHTHTQVLLACHVAPH